MAPGKPLRSQSELKRGAPLRQTSNGSGVSVGTRPRRSNVTSSDTIPPKVRGQVSDRDPWCVRCGSPHGLHQHHRRLKGSGGDPRSHTDCACNLVRLCPGCHLEVHKHRSEAEAEGFIVPAETVLPGSVSVAVATADGGLALFPDCDGEWSTAAPEGRAA